ncbi:MAG: hypothetical protein LBU11_00035 [Zoogloeaceae bacterium]|nr:hypothetical protein [Zoogloeaceae bacterium]
MALSPLFVALHRTGTLSLSGLAMQYEDVLAKRLENQESAEDADLLRQLVVGLHRLAEAERPYQPAPPASEV